MPSVTASRRPGTWRPAPGPRVGSWLVDWAVVGAWLGVLTLVGFVLLPALGVPRTFAVNARSLLVSDLAITLATVVPYVCYLSLTESSARHATLGKRLTGLEVAALDGGAPSVSAVWLRNVVKAAPWQLGHLGAARGILEIQQGLGLVLTVLALALVAACAIPALVGGRGVHDRAAGTQVQRGEGHGEASEGTSSGPGAPR